MAATAARKMPVILSQSCTIMLPKVMKTIFVRILAPIWDDIKAINEVSRLSLLLLPLMKPVTATFESSQSIEKY
jgi:hypothetical protein